MDKVFIDVGAGSGQEVYSNEYRNVILIEPHPRFLPTLTRKFERDVDYTIIPKALVAQEESSSRFNLNRPSRWSSFFDPADLLKRYCGFSTLDRIDVPQISVSELIRGMTGCEVSVRLDCCGNELALLEAFAQSLPAKSRFGRITVSASNDTRLFTSSASLIEIQKVLESEFFYIEHKETVDDRDFVHFKYSELDKIKHDGMILRKNNDELQHQLQEAKHHEMILGQNNEELQHQLQEAKHHEMILGQNNEELQQELQNQLQKAKQDELIVKEGNKLLQHQLKEAHERFAQQSNLLEALQNLEASIRFRMRIQSEVNVKQIESYIAVKEFFATGHHGFDFHGWPISSEIAIYLLRRVSLINYDCIIEFGSGTSTTMFAEALIKNSKADGRKKPAKASFRKIVSFEHDQLYVEKTKELLAASGVESQVDLIHAPLEQITISGRDFLYYSCDDKLAQVAAALKNKGAKVLVLIDGPPSTTGENARFPALPKLLTFLGNHQLDVLVDDYYRDSESAMVAEWEHLLESEGTSFVGEKIDAEKGAYMLQVNQDSQV